ncbi:ankyrin repeat protein [Burkholderiales bacterium JOSHI_001]|nr:ankyrin repeat protein [Burkholderiales bacterium JOSHI_001]
MGLFEWLGLGSAQAEMPDARAPRLESPERFFEGPSLPLLRAALAGDEAGVRQALAQGANPNAQGPKSNSKATPQLTLLHYAVGMGNERAMALLIQAGADAMFQPRPDDGPALSFPILRKDPRALESLLRHWPLSRVPAQEQFNLADDALMFGTRTCMEVLFRNGLSPAVTDSLNRDLFIKALLAENLDVAEWLLMEVGTPLSTTTTNGLTPPNYVQEELTRYRPGTPTHTRYLKFKAFMESKGVKFPVETSAEWRARNGKK